MGRDPGEIPVRVGMRGERELGSGTLLMLAVVMFSGFLVLVTGALASAIVARHRAEAAADLAALAAASRLSVSDGCAQANRVALANAGRLQQCRWLPDGSVLVGVELRSPGSWALGPVRAVARAGADVDNGGPGASASAGDGVGVDVGVDSDVDAGASR